MATVKLVIAGEKLGEIAAGFDLPDGDAARILAWAADTHGQIVTDARTGEERDMAPDEVLRAVALDLLGQTIARVTDYERDQAAKRAAAEVRPIAAIPMDDARNGGTT